MLSGEGPLKCRGEGPRRTARSCIRFKGSGRSELPRTAVEKNPEVNTCGCCGTTYNSPVTMWASIPTLLATPLPVKEGP